MTTRYNRKDFLDALFFNYCRDKGGFILAKIADRYMVKAATRYFPNPDTLAREQYADDQNVLFGVCPREKMKPGKEFVRHLTAVWAGLDIGPDGYSGKEKHFVSDKQAIIAIRSFPLEPSILVQSGRGLHLVLAPQRSQRSLRSAECRSCAEKGERLLPVSFGSQP